MPDPKAVFAAGTDTNRAMLQRLWPALYNALAGTAPGEQRTIWCVVGDPDHIRRRVPAAGRITRMGHPACADHVAKLADRPGGWPLPAEENHKDDHRS